MFYSGNILRRKIFVNVSGEKTQTQMLTGGNYNMLQDFIIPVIDKLI